MDGQGHGDHNGCGTSPPAALSGSANGRRHFSPLNIYHHMEPSIVNWYGEVQEETGGCRRIT